MHLIGEGNIEASLAIGAVLKISRSQYINDQPSHFPSCYVALNKPDPRSPTNSMSLNTVTYRIADAFVEISPALKEHLEEVKQPMRPTPAQLLNPHPTYLDCIVFPQFRERAVRASVDGVLDHAQLFTDFMHGGLVCWGGMSGLANKHGRSGRSGKRDMRDNVAWSSRSWEAKKWFLKKWTWLIGTEEEEEARGDADGIWQSSRWWWAMRGEDDSDEDDDAQEFESWESQRSRSWLALSVMVCTRCLGSAGRDFHASMSSPPVVKVVTCTANNQRDGRENLASDHLPCDDPRVTR